MRRFETAQEEKENRLQCEDFTRANGQKPPQTDVLDVLIYKRVTPIRTSLC